MISKWGVWRNGFDRIERWRVQNIQIFRLPRLLRLLGHLGLFVQRRLRLFIQRRLRLLNIRLLNVRLILATATPANNSQFLWFVWSDKRRVIRLSWSLLRLLRLKLPTSNWRGWLPWLPSLLRIKLFRFTATKSHLKCRPLVAGSFWLFYFIINLLEKYLFILLFSIQRAHGSV